MAFVCQALALANKISVVKKAFTNYRVGTGTSMQQTNDRYPIAFWDAYTETKRRLIEAGVYDKYEQSFLNHVLEGIFYNLNSVKTTRAYRDILSLIKYHANEEFGFMRKPVGHYYNLNRLSDYCKIIGQVKNAPVPVKEPKISVVIPSLNARNYIRECIESVLEQTLEEIEVLCVDAGSTDGTLDILEGYASLDKRIKIIHSDKKSYGYQMNLGIKAAKGEYLAIVETDDFIIPNTYQQLYKVAKDNDVEVLRADFHIFIGEKGKYKLGLRKSIANSDYYNKILDPSKDIAVCNCRNVPWSGLYKLAFLKEKNILLNETPGAAYQDNGLWFQCFTQSHRIYFFNKSFYRLRRDNPESSVYSKSKVFCMCEEYDFIRKNLEALDMDDVLKEKFVCMCAYKRFINYSWRLKVIAEEFRLAYLKRFAEDFKKIDENGELDSSLFSERQWNQLQSIMKDPEEYYRSTVIPVGLPRPKTDEEVRKDAEKRRKRQLEQKNKEVIKLKKENLELKTRINEIRKSKSFKVGETLAWPVRKLRNVLK